jgi:hypothetical protein
MTAETLLIAATAVPLALVTGLGTARAADA